MRLSGRFAVANTAAAATKAALLDLGRSATLKELQHITGHSYSAITGKRGANGLLQVI